MAIKKILQLGNPELYKKSEKLLKSDDNLIVETVNDLHDTMLDFRKKYNCGRAIAAPQIGIQKRLIYMNIESEETVFINPEITEKSEETYILWDDCMSFPDLLVKVERYKSIKVEFSDDLSELFQHEYDHLDGILATMRAIDDKSIIYKSEKQEL